MKLSANLPSLPCDIFDLSHPISLGVSVFVAGSDIYRLICWRSLWALCTLFYLIYRGVSKLLGKYCFAIVSGVLGSLIPDFCSCCTFTKNVLTVLFPSISPYFRVSVLPQFLVSPRVNYLILRSKISFR